MKEHFSAHKKDEGTATNQEGVPAPSLTASLAINGKEHNSHILLQDSFLIEKTAAFNRERIPGSLQDKYFKVDS